MERKLSLILLFCCLFCAGCDPMKWASAEWFVEVVNEREADIVLTVGLQLEGEQFHTVTYFPEIEDYEVVKAGKSRKYTKFYWQMDFAKSDSISFFIISPDVLKTHSWQEIGEQELFLKKYTFKYPEFPHPLVYPHEYD